MEMHDECKIRVAKDTDAKELVSIYAPYVRKTAISFEYEVPTVEEFAIRIRNTQNKYPYFVAEKNGEIVGYTYAGGFHARAAYQWGAESSIYVREDMRGMGVGRLLYTELENALKKMGILNINACIGYPPIEDEYLTKASEKFHEHMGFVKVAQSHKCGFKFGKWYDIIWMEKMIGEHTADPAPVKSFSQIFHK